MCLWPEVMSAVQNQYRYCYNTAAYLQMRNTVFVCVEVLRPSQPNGVMSSTVSLPNHTFTGQA